MQDTLSSTGSGLSMLSDGVDRSFGLEGLQALGASDSSITMKHLKLHGCSLLSTLSMKAISNCSNLETLDLSGCTRLTINGAKCIGESCRKISVLSLASCGDCISNAVVEAIVSNLDLLTSANLQFCPKVGERSLKAISACTGLQTLDLTGCSGVTDQAILHLSEGNFVPGLRHLFLAQCSKVGDTSLSWITEGLKQTLDGTISLETLSLKGTKVTPDAVKGIRDRLPYSSMRRNTSFHGFWPLNRTNDRKLVNHYHKRACAAAIIQARVRSLKEKDTLMLARKEYCKKRVAIRIQSVFRGRKARMLFGELKRRKKELLINSLRLQCAFRCRIARKRLNRQRELKWLTVAPQNCIIIQRRWRGIRGRAKTDRKRKEKLREHEQRVNASMRIQSWSRMLSAKQTKLLLLHQWLTSELNQWKAAIKIQSMWRTYVGKQILFELKAKFKEQQELERASAARIEGAYRTILFRKVIKHRIARTRKRLESTLIIQQWYRNEKARILNNLLHQQELAAARLCASTLIQIQLGAIFLGRTARRHCLELKRRKNELIALREQSATTLCRWGRVCIAKMRVQKRREEFDEEIRRTLILKIWASTKIAAGWRGKLGRDRARQCIIIRAQRWKAMYDQTEERTFYYNQDTGETRWEKPQCLLDLEPKPVCSNCSELLAEIECADCQEFFCTKCFEFIHHGGKRASHAFRFVYDYYGKRKDYDREPWQTFVSKTII